MSEETAQHSNEHEFPTEMDKIYLQHQSTCINTAGSRSFPFLSLSVTINVALYAAFYVLFAKDKQDIWAYRNLELFILMLIILINLAVYVIYYREHNLDLIINRKFFGLFREEGAANFCSKVVIDMGNAIKNEDAANVGVTMNV